ncbi:MAG: putative lipid II flippase FtsW [Deltaproteobacteria bacterium]|nr:putative lipid II flippase FtsW [Deltaproteobacteria bacterium]
MSTVGSLARPWNAEARREPVVLRPGKSGLALWIGTAGLVALGFVMVLNTSYFHAQERFGDPYLFARKHLAAIALGGAAMVLFWRVSTRTLRRATYPLLLLSLALLAAVLVPDVGVVRGGARRWLKLGPLTLQPSEIAKLSAVLYLAHSLTKKGARIGALWTGYLPHLVVVGALSGLVVLEPDFGTAVLLAVLLFVMLLANGARLSHLGATASLAAPFAIFAAVTASYRWQRLTSFLDPWRDARKSGFQLVQSLLAFGTGGVFGVGLGASRQKMFYLPEAHTDFVFAVIGEELGLIGTLSVLATFGLLAAAGLRLAWRHVDPYAANLALGVTAIIVLQAGVNMAVSVGLLPTKGLALPFLSYGGSALVANMIEMGILLSVARESA